MKLQDLASVRSGLVLSRKQSKEPVGYPYRSINLRAIQSDASINLSEVDVYQAKELLKSEYLSQKGDIVVRLTTPYTAVLIDETTAGMVISSNFVVIRIESQAILPEYLFWLLNTQSVKHDIYENATSNMLGAVNAKFLAEIEVAVLPIKDQYKIAQIYMSSRHEIRLLKELADEKEKYYAKFLEQTYKKLKRGK